MILKFEVLGLHNNSKSIVMEFNNDLNIITGKNGSGKTTILKLLWYLLSGNITRAIEEIDFDYAKLITDTISITLGKISKEWNDKHFNKASIEHIQEYKNNRKKEKLKINFEYLIEIKEGTKLQVAVYTEGSVKIIDAEVANRTKNSVFFPTFRRLEGGYSMKDQSRYARRYMQDSEIEDAIKMFSRRLSNINHSFITSVSTRDIVELVTEQFANNSEHTNKLHIELSEYIEDKINKYSKLDDSKVEDAKDVLSDIQSQLRGISGKREQLLKPFTLLSKLVEQIFQHKGIQLTENITLGETKESMFSDRLSAGEKQMLSFICYNSFYEHGVIFIDEPEISLHVDWQRILFPTLLSQSTNNQFIIATHSPFIYSKYTDKEILLSEDRGGY